MCAESAVWEGLWGGGWEFQENAVYGPRVCDEAHLEAGRGSAHECVCVTLINREELNTQRPQ